MDKMESREFSDLLGRTIVKIEGGPGDDAMRFVCDNGDFFLLHHYQECCESVSIDDICGDVNDLIGSPILFAEESTNENMKPKEEYDESFTWTFYKLATQKGWVDIRWYGASNGYYSEGVYFEQAIKC